MNPLILLFLYLRIISQGVDLLVYLLFVLVCLKALDMALTHTNLKTWIAKAKWGVVHGARLLDRAIMRFVDNRDDDAVS